MACRLHVRRGGRDKERRRRKNLDSATRHRSPVEQRTGRPAMNSYARFGAMIATSTVVMFGLMYLNTYQLDHVFFSQTRAYMALIMGAAMAAIMLGFMTAMYA